MNIPASTILSFVTGRLYSDKAPTVLFGQMLAAFTGRKSIYTHDLPALKEKHAEDILAQCTSEFQQVCKTWKHSEDWKTRVNNIDTMFGEINIDPPTKHLTHD